MSDTTSRGFTRRNFIKGAALLGATGALVGCSPQQKGMEDAKTSDVAKDDIFAGVCSGNCFGGCFLNVHVRDGQLVRTSARDMIDTRYNRICSKGLSSMARIYSANRLQYPMRRVGERGEGKFERISWDEAIDEIVNKWKGYEEEVGPGAVGLISQSGNLNLSGGIHGIGASLTKFANIMGFSKINGNLDWGVVMSGIISYGGNALATGNEPTDYENASTFVIWGSNPAVSQPQVMHFITEAQEKGTKVISIDPVFNASSSRADQFIPINATTDGALAMGIINEVIANGWEDVDFLREHSEAPLLIKEDGMLLRMSDMGVEPTEGEPDPLTGKPTVVDPYVVWDEETGAYAQLDEAKKPALTGVSEVEGIAVRTTFDRLKEEAEKYPLDRVEEITGVPVDVVKGLAEAYTQNGPTLTYMHYGTDHYINGHWNCWAIYALGMVCGQIGKPGATVGNSGVNASGLCNSAACMPEGAKGIAGMYNLDLLNEIMDNGTYNGAPATLKGLYIMGANPVSVYAQQGYIKDVFSKMDFIVVADNSMNDTAKWADILLPAASWSEQTDIYGGCGTHPYFLWNEKAIEPMYESKPDFEIYKMICEKMGVGDQWGWNTVEDALREYLDTEALHELGVEFDKIKEDKIVRVLPGEVFRQHEGGVFLTPTKRCKFYQETPFADTVGQELDIEKERVPHWEATLEADKNSEARKTHPFHLLSDHMRTRTHTQWWDVEWLKEVEYETPMVKLNPSDAEELGIVEGDQVRVYNDRGSVVLTAALNAGLPRGMASAPRGFQQSEFIDGHFATLSIMKFNQACANQPFNDVAVSIEKM